MLLLAVKGITESNRKFLSQYDVTVVTPDTITAHQIPEIVISYAWDDAIGQKILANPNSKLKWIQTQSAGVDYLPLKKLKDFGVVVTNASGLKAIPIAQTVLSYIILCTWFKYLCITNALGTLYQSILSDRITCFSIWYGAYWSTNCQSY